MRLATVCCSSASLALAVLLGGTAASLAVAQPGDGVGYASPGLQGKLPKGVLLVKGATASASDELGPLPEGGRLGAGFYQNDYFKLHVSFPGAWRQQYDGPPPSDSGHYVLALLQPPDSAARTRGTLQIAALDLFFTPSPAASALDLMRATQASVQSTYKLEQPLAQVQLGGHTFMRLGYSAPQSGLHWQVLATEIRCHLVQFVITSPDARFINTTLQALRRVELPADAGVTSGTGGADAPVCIAGYARPENILSRVEPVLPAGKSNPIPVRIIIDATGQVRHIHLLSAFPDQAQAIITALKQWRFRAHVLNGQPVEVETGILFGRARRPGSRPSDTAPLS
jgi:hypothetical protein